MPWIQTAIDVGIGIVVFIIVKWIGPNAVQTVFQTQLEDHKGKIAKELEEQRHEFARTLEALRADNSRLIQNFGLYNTKRHRTYSQIYEYLLEAQGHLHRKTIKLVQLDPFEGYSVASITEYAKKRRFPDQIIERIVDKWESDREMAVNLVWEWDVHYSRSEMADSVIRFHNYYLSKILYLSDRAREAFHEIDSHMISARHSYEFHDNWRSQGGSSGMNDAGRTYADLARKNMEELEKHVHRLDELREEVMNIMVEEMKTGTL